jgi:hypothetical protein
VERRLLKVENFLKLDLQKEAGILQEENFRPRRVLVSLRKALMFMLVDEKLPPFKNATFKKMLFPNFSATL